MNIIVRSAPGMRQAGIMQLGSVRLRCALGRSGIQVIKHEGDGATPAGSLRLLKGFCKGRIPPKGYCPITLRPHHKQDGWCDAPQDANYNRPVRLPYHASAEEMYRKDELYDIGFVLDWNISTRRKKGGSAIFLHLAKEEKKGGHLSATQGCIALTRRNMKRILPYLARDRKIIICP